MPIPAESKSSSAFLGLRADQARPRQSRTLAPGKEEVLANYDKYYQNLGMDGIYFQTFTEQDNTMLGGRTIASLACDWVNDIAHALLLEHPALRIEWGLHASSIRDHYPDLKPLDPRLTIVWEDAGDLSPFAYDPGVCRLTTRRPAARTPRMRRLDIQETCHVPPGSEFGIPAPKVGSISTGRPNSSIMAPSSSASARMSLSATV